MVEAEAEMVQAFTVKAGSTRLEADSGEGRSGDVKGWQWKG